jgi:tRNA nucleotidyltransferase (CCA-adding enzyme)
MVEKIRDIVSKQILMISPTKLELEELEQRTKKVLFEINSKIKKFKIKARVFVGGSFAKKTIIRKNKYDIDLFVRFNKSYTEKELSKYLAKIIPRGSEKVHGSRDYYRLKISSSLEFEIIPVFEIKKPSESKNTTDLSYFHVNYISKAIAKNKKLADEIKIAKAFAHYQDCYGAESYIRGFSGYSLEILVVYYGSFEKFIRAMVKIESGKRVYLDPAKFYKNSQEIVMLMNESKIYSPIVLIDPTFKERNALAGLSAECLERFRLACIKFIKSPNSAFFVSKDKEGDFDKKYSNNVIKIEVKTNKQAGDIAGTKIRRFYEYFIKQTSRYFKIMNSGFVYDDSSNVGKLLIVVDVKNKVEFRGPPVEMKNQLALFKKEHSKIIIRGGVAWAYEENYKDFNEFFKDFKKKNFEVIKAMDVWL